jgi:methyl coenzyme M reductase subunit C-like uncharacterized protein (methanogenesis marker protein 7)
VTYCDPAELAKLLHVDPVTHADALGRVIGSAQTEIDAELGRDAAYDDDAVPPLVAEVCLERSVEHWQQMQSPFGVIGLGGEFPTRTGADSWNRHANKLAPLRESWGIA